LSLPLQTHGIVAGNLPQSVLGRIATEDVPVASRADHIRLVRGRPEPEMLRGYVALLTAARGEADASAWPHDPAIPVVHSAAHLDHLKAGDVVAIRPNGHIRTLYRIDSSHNVLFTTDRCNSFCLMCSQPPKPADDSHRVRELLRLVDLIDLSCRELGITGGEPTLLKGDLLRIIERCRDRLPETALHVLSNGRLFYYGSFASDLAALAHPDLMLGIPLYSDLDYDHDFVVQASGAFHQTVIGLQNLGRYRIPVEIRVVIHRHTYRRLPALAEFIYRNFPFAAHVALMGLEPMGFAVSNLEQLWIDPFDYQNELCSATTSLSNRGMNVSIYNHQLCVLPREVWSFARQSISDWKNDYLPICATCEERDACGGFFSSALKRAVSDHISPLQTHPQ
jgi:His-Xaa-Ser system radical SAM maturase HxsC